MDFKTLGINAKDNILFNLTTESKAWKIDDSDEAKEFNNNLGYYFWFANSESEKKITGNLEIPSTSTLASEAKLSSIITQLQHSYNATKSSEVKARILDIVKGISQTTGINGFLPMLLFIGVLVALFYCLLGYGLRVLINEIMLMLSILGMSLAGVLLLTVHK